MSDPVPNITTIKDLLADALIELQPPEIVSSFTNEECVTFRQTLPSYHKDDDILVVYTIAPGYIPSTHDWVGLYSVEWMKPTDFLTFLWAPVKGHDSKSPKLMRLVFKVSQLKFESDISSKYQFVYLTKSNNILGTSPSFVFNQFKQCSDVLLVSPSSDMQLQVPTLPNRDGSDHFELVPMLEETVVQGPNDWVCMAIKHHADNSEGDEVEETCKAVMPYTGNTPLHAVYAEQFPLPENQPSEKEMTVLIEKLLKIGHHCTIVPVPLPISRGILAPTVMPKSKTEATPPCEVQKDPAEFRPPTSLRVTAKRRRLPCRSCQRKHSHLRQLQKDLVQIHEQVKELKCEVELSDEKLAIKEVLVEELCTQVRHLVHENGTLTATNEHLATDYTSCHEELKELKELHEVIKKDGEKLKEELHLSQTSLSDLSVKLQDVYTTLNMRGITFTMDNNEGNLEVSKEARGRGQNATDWTVTTSKRTERLLMTIAQQDDLITSLQTKCKHFVEVQTQAAEREASLNASLTVTEQEAQQTKQLAKDKDSRLDELEEEIKTQDNKITFLLQDARERESLIKEFKAKFISAQDTRASLEKSVSHFIAEQNTLKEQLCAARKMIQEERRCNAELRLQSDVAHMQHQEQVTSLQDALNANALIKKGREASKWKMGWDFSKLITEFCSSMKLLCEQCGQPLCLVSPDASCNATSQTQADVKSQQQQTNVCSVTSQSIQASQSMKQAASQTSDKKSKHMISKDTSSSSGITNRKRNRTSKTAEDPEEPAILETGAHGSSSTSPLLYLEDETSSTTSWAEMCDNETSDLIHGFSFMAGQTVDNNAIYTQPESRPAPYKHRKPRKYHIKTYRHHSNRGRGPIANGLRILQPTHCSGNASKSAAQEE